MVVKVELEVVEVEVKRGCPKEDRSPLELRAIRLAPKVKSGL